MADSYPAPKPKKVASNATRLPRAATPRTRQVPDIKNARQAGEKDTQREQGTGMPEGSRRCDCGVVLCFEMVGMV